MITPMLDIRSIGAGGGSIAWIDDGGSLRVGPQSAGADPGPACYGRGGTRPTVTDANLVLGRIDPTLGGKFELDRDAAMKAIETVAEPLGMSALALRGGDRGDRQREHGDGDPRRSRSIAAAIRATT